MSEKEFLDRQERLAIEALWRQGGNLKRDLERTLHLEAVAGQHPVLWIGAGAVAGWLAGRLLLPRARGLSAVAGGVASAVAPTLLKAVLGLLAERRGPGIAGGGGAVG